MGAVYVMTKRNIESTAYENYGSWKKWDLTPFGTVKVKQHFYFAKLLAPYLRGRDAGHSVLEIGFGNGELAGWLNAHHSHISWTGIELQESLVSKARAAGFQAEVDISKLDLQTSYDLIIAIDVIEHLSDIEIQDLFSRFNLLLKEDGTVITRTPNAAGPLGLPNQTGDATHITPISLSRLAGYLSQWEITEKGDIQPVWEGKVLSALRNCFRLALRTAISGSIRFVFSPQPKTLLASNLHLFFKKRSS